MASGELCAAVKHSPHLSKKIKKKEKNPAKQEDYGWEMRSSCEEEG